MTTLDLIKETFDKTPSDLRRIRELLSSHELTAEDLAELAIAFTDECFLEYHDALDSQCESVNIGNLHSDHIVDAIRLLLDFGLNPNSCVDEDNVMWNSIWIDAPNVGASVLRSLLENGGDPNHRIPPDMETIFDYIDFKVSYDEYMHEYFYTVQCWLVLMAYGAYWQDNRKIPLTMLGDNTVEIFKNFELYDYTIELLPQEPGKFGCWIMHIFNTETSEEVAVYK